MKSERGLVERIAKRIPTGVKWSRGARIGEAGFMPHELARAIIEEVADAIEGEKRFMISTGGEPGPLDVASWLRTQAQESEE